MTALQACALTCVYANTFTVVCLTFWLIVTGVSQLALPQPVMPSSYHRQAEGTESGHFTCRHASRFCSSWRAKQTTLDLPRYCFATTSEVPRLHTSEYVQHPYSVNLVDVFMVMQHIASGAQNTQRRASHRCNRHHKPNRQLAT